MVSQLPLLVNLYDGATPLPAKVSGKQLPHLQILSNESYLQNNIPQRENL